MIVVDIETTGLNPLKHALISIGAVDFFNPENQFYGECRVDDDALITEESLSVNGFTLEQIKDTKKPELKELMQKFIAWFSQIPLKTIAGMNPQFDYHFLVASAKKCGLPTDMFNYHLVDLYTTFYVFYLKKIDDKLVHSIRTNFIYNYLGLPEEPYPHHGLTGAKMEAEAFSRLIYAKPLFEEFKKYPLPDYL